MIISQRGIAVAATVLIGALSAFAFYAATPSASTYRFAFAFLCPLLWAVFALGHTLALRTGHFALFALALLLHNMGVFGFYRRDFLGLEFDIYVHFYFGFVAGLIIAQAFRVKLCLSGVTLIIGVSVFVLGLGGIHELIEYVTTLILGPEKGMLKINDPDKYDTQKDLLNNFLGTFVALAVSWVALPASRNVSEPGKTDPKPIRDE